MMEVASPGSTGRREMLLWILPPVLLGVFSVISGYNGLYGQDSYEYLRYSRALHLFMAGGAPPGPFLWPVLYPLAGALVSFILPAIFSLQLVSLAALGISSFFLREILNRLFPEYRTGTLTYTFLFYSLSPFILRYSASIMSESLALLFLTGFFNYYLAYFRERKPAYFLRLCLFAACAINTRYPTLVILAVPLVHTIFIFVKNFHWRALAGSVLILAVVFLPGVLATRLPGGTEPLQTNLEFWSGKFLQWSPANFFKSSFLTEDGHLHYPFPNLIYILSCAVHPGFLFTGFLFVIFIGSPENKWKHSGGILASLAVYLLFLAGLPVQNDRLVLLGFPIVLIFFAGTFLRLYNRFLQKKKWRVLFITGVILIQLAIFYRAFLPFYRDNRDTRYIATRISAYPDKTIYTFNIDQALKAYGVQNRIVNIWEKPVREFEPHALVLFNLTKTAVQWKGLNPMLNWEKVNREHHLKILEQFPMGWELYGISD